jgi:uncharacterized repeat protein (TIGR03847 family)
MFFLQVDVAVGRRWFLLEKQQLAVMAERLLGVLREIGVTARTESPALAQPDAVSFRVGEIVIGQADGCFTVSLQPTEVDDDGELDGVRFDVEYEMIGGMAEAALGVVAAGRPLCQFCNLPKDPEGHVCPATNGHRGARLES